MAEVYRARDELLGREVAVKVLSERFAGDTSFVERFRREAQSAANLNHPNIVSLYDYGSDDDSYFIVMEFIDGRSLADIIRDEGPLLPERAAEITSDVADALERAHTGGLVHRDIKPGNIMITSSGQTKVTDFGIARALRGNTDQTMTQTGMVIGTAAYLSPEQAQGSPVDARSDVYSLGVVLFEMLTGRPPFAGDSPISIAYKHVRESPVPPSSVNTDVPQALDSIVLKALAKNPDNRYSSAREMRDDLQRFLTGQPVRATPLLADTTMVAPATSTGTQVMTAPTFDEPPSRRGGWYLLSALAILILFGVIAWVLLSNSLDDSPTDVEVPDLVGLHVDEARDLLQEEGLKAAVEREPSRRPEDRVIDQEPEEGEPIEEGGTVTLVVSEGPRQVEVPELVGLTQDEAEDLLADARLRLGEVTPQITEEFEPGEVIAQSPEPGTDVAQGSRVSITVAAEPDTVIVPSVEGQPEADAVAEIEAAGLVAEVVTEASSEVEEGIVIAQDPAAGAEVAPGDTVRIVVSEGTEEQPMPDMTGRDGDEAEAELESDFGLVVEQVTATGACAQPPGAVCAQDPQPGEPISPGDSATLYVQAGDAGIGSSLFAAALWFLGLA